MVDETDRQIRTRTKKMGNTEIYRGLFSEDEKLARGKRLFRHTEQGDSFIFGVIFMMSYG
jgi:hypothetical protein